MSIDAMFLCKVRCNSLPSMHDHGGTLITMDSLILWRLQPWDRSHKKRKGHYFRSEPCQGLMGFHSSSLRTAIRTF